MMKDERLLTLIATYGADPSAYPAAEQEEARALLLAAPERFADAVTLEQSLDTLFADLPEIVPSESLETELLASAPVPARTRQRKPSWGMRWPAIGGALASLAVGLTAGLSVAAPASATDTTADEVDTLVMAALGVSDYDLMQEGEYE